MTSSLVVLNGGHPGTTVTLEPTAPAVTIGRHATNDLQLDDDRVSRLHARVVYRGERWHLEDCGSLNGTYVNSQPIGQTVLEAGDLIRIGERLVLFVKCASRTDLPRLADGLVPCRRRPWSVALRPLAALWSSRA